MSDLDFSKVDLDKIGIKRDKEIDFSKVDLDKIGIKRDKNIIDNISDTLEATGSKIYDGINTITKPAIDTAKNIKNVVKTAADTVVTPITKIANASVPININYKEIEKQPQKSEPIIRARTAYDDSPYIIRSATPIIRARTKLDDIRQTTAQIDKDREGIEHDPIIEAVVNPATMLGKGVITKGGLAIFEAIQQAKNAAVSKYKGKDFDLLAYENLTSLLPENTPQTLKIAAGLGEMVGDAIIAGKLETATRNFFIRDTADRLKFELEKKGYNENEINDVLSKFYKKIINRQEVKNLENKNLIGKQVEQKPINIDEAISLNKQIRKIEVPQAKPKQESLKADMDIEVVRENSKLNDVNELVATKDITSGEIADDIIKEVAPLKKLEKANTIETVRQKVDKKFLTELRQDVVDVLNAGELKNIDFGELSAAKLEALNKIRELNNVELLEDNRLVIPANVVKKLIEKRMLKDKMSAEEVADLLIDVFHGDNTKIAGTKHKHIQVMFKVLDKVSKVGFVSKNPANKDTVIKGGYKVDTKRLLNNIIKGEVLDGHGSPSSVLIPEGNKVAAPRNISALQNSPDDIIGQNNDGVNNLESDAIETGNENVDTSFEPAEFDEEYAKAMEEQQKLLIEEMKENGAIPTIKSEKQRLQDMGIGKILRPKKDDPMYAEYKHLSPRIQREFFYDESDGLVNNSKGYTWDNAEHDLQQATGTDTTIWEELENIDRNVSKYENLGLANGKNNNKIQEDSLDDVIEFVLNSEPVAKMTGKEFLPDGKKLTEKVPEYWNQEYGGKVIREPIGEILLDERSVRDSMGHGLHRYKVIGFACAPDVITKGKIVEYIPNRNNKNYDSVTFIAPIEIGGKPFVEEVIVKSNKDRTGLYVHRVEIRKKLEDVLKTAHHGTSPASKLSIIHKILEVKRNKANSTNKLGSYSSVLKTGVKVGAEETPKEADFKLYQRTYDLAKKYSVNGVNESKYRPRKTLGVYYNYGSGKGNIFLNSLLNVDVVAHELVHAIDDKLHIITDLYDKGFKEKTVFKGKKAITGFVPDISTQEGKVADELLKAAKDLYPTDISKQSVKSRLAEGLATLIQHSIINPDMIEQTYGNAYKWAMSNETLQSFRDDARQIIVDYENLSPVEKITTEMYDKPLQVSNKKEIPLKVFLDRTIFDSEAILKWLDEDLYLTAKGYRKILGSVIGANLHNEDGKFFVFDSDGNPQEINIGDNWRTFLKKVKKTNSKFDEYLIARRFVAWYDKRDKIANGLVILNNNLQKLQQRYNEITKKIEKDDFYTIHDQKAAYELAKSLKIEINKLTNRIEQESEKLKNLQDIITANGKNETEIKDAFNELDNGVNKQLANIYDNLHNATLKTLHDTGVITDELYKEFLNNYGYAPFNRNIYDEIYADDKNSFFKSVLKLAGKNATVKYKGVNQPLKNLRKIKGSELAIISPVTSSVRFMASAYREAYKQVVINKLVQIADTLPEFMQKVPYTKGMEHDQNVFVGKINDKKVAVKIKDPNIRDTFKELFDMGLPDGAYKIALAATRLFTKLTTGLSPKFAAGNLLRDQMTAFVSSKTGYIPLISQMELLANPKSKQFADEYDSLFGGETNSRLGNLTIVNPLEMGNALGKNKTEKVIDFIEKPLNLFPSWTESLARKAEYVKMRLNGADVKTASRAAEEITGAFGDFGRWFGSNAIKTLIKLNAFLNATLQVGRIYLRSVSNPKTFTRFLVTLGAISALAYYTITRLLDSENEYQRNQLLQIMPEMLTRYLYLPSGNDEFIRVPVDNVFASLGVFFAMLYANDKYNARYKLSDMLQVLTDVVPDRFNFIVTAAKIKEIGVTGAARQMVSWIPQPLVPAFGLVLGKRVFPDWMDIEPMSIQKYPERYRFNNRTSETAKWIGNKTNTSPMKIDYFLDQQFGQVGKMAIRSTEKMLYPKNQNIDDNFVASINIFKNLSYFSSGRLIQDFYDNKKWTDQLRAARDNGFELSTKEMNFLRISDKATKKIADTIKKYSQVVKALNENRNDLSLDEQQRIKEDLQKQEIDIIRLIQDYNNKIKG